MNYTCEKVWLEYKKTKDPLLKEKLIIEYAPLVKYVAGRISIHIGQHVEYDDLISYGIFGLIDAIDKFDCEKGVKFETYASLRIRGEIIDNIRKLDWVPRTLRQKSKVLEQAYTELEFSLGREPSESEIAQKLNLTNEQVQELMKSSSVAMLISLDDYLDQNHEAPMVNVVNANIETPEVHFEKEEVKTILTNAINSLNEKEKKVVTLYYFEELTLKEISKIMGVSESRISQIHSKAVLKLQSKLGKYKSILFLN